MLSWRQQALHMPRSHYRWAAVTSRGLLFVTCYCYRICCFSKDNMYNSLPPPLFLLFLWAAEISCENLSPVSDHTHNSATTLRSGSCWIRKTWMCSMLNTKWLLLSTTIELQLLVQAHQLLSFLSIEATLPLSGPLRGLPLRRLLRLTASKLTAAAAATVAAPAASARGIAWEKFPSPKYIGYIDGVCGLRIYFRCSVTRASAVQFVCGTDRSAAPSSDRTPVLARAVRTDAIDALR